MSVRLPAKATKAEPARLSRPGKARVVGRPEDLLEEAVGVLSGGDPGQAQLLGQALLQGPEHALRAPPRLRRIGRDQLDAELLKRPAHLGRIVLVDLAAGLRRVPVVRRPIGIERAEQAPLGDHLRKRLETAHSAFLGDEKARVDLAGRIVQGHHQVPHLARHPCVAGRRPGATSCPPPAGAAACVGAPRAAAPALIRPCACKVVRSQL